MDETNKRARDSYRLLLAYIAFMGLAIFAMLMSWETFDAFLLYKEKDTEFFEVLDDKP